MGMKTIKLTSSKRAGGTEERSQSSPCTGTRLARCPATWNKAEPAYSPTFPYSVDELPEGIDHFGVKAVDIVENGSLPEGAPDESVVTPTKVDRTAPADLAASGELFELANRYIDGQGTKTVGVSATDNLSGVRSLSLEDEGHGILATYTPPSCVFTPLREDQCPLQASDTLSVDTGQMPEGANHLRVVAEDLAGNVADGETWTVYVDRTAPNFNEPAAFRAIQEPGSALTSVISPEASDPALSDGSPGSGVASYYLRYSIGSGTPSEWLTNSIPYFQISDPQPSEPLHLEAYAADLVGNRSQTRSATVSVEAPTSQEEFVNTPEGGNCSVGDPCGENAFPRSQKEAEAEASTTVPEDPNSNAGGFQSSSNGSAARAQAAPAATAALHTCRGRFANVVSSVFFKRGKYGTLYWDFFLTPDAIDVLGPEVLVGMAYADVNGNPINPPYSPHKETSDYDFHSSMRKYQGLKGFPSGTVKTGDTVTLIWVIASVDDPGEGAYRNITCTVPQPGVG